MDNELRVSQECALAARKTTNILGYTSNHAPSRTREWLCPSTAH